MPARSGPTSGTAAVRCWHRRTMKKMWLALTLLAASCGKEEPKSGGMNYPATVSADRVKDPVCGMPVDRANARPSVKSTVVMRKSSQAT